MTATRPLRQVAALAWLALATTALPPQAGEPAPAARPARAPAYLARLPEDEVLYFLLPDRFENGDPSNDLGGLTGDRLHTGFDPTSTGFYHGGDLKGVLQRLDYIQALGATAIWLGPVFRNLPVQGQPGHESAGYHGYWITDFEHVDPHLGTDADLKALIDSAHARGIKIYLDIVINHTADVIRYRECPNNDCAYRSIADYPYTRRGGIAGAPINAGFGGDGERSVANFTRLKEADWAYTPYVPAGLEHAKSPDWLNDPIHYHNRGDSTFEGESSTYGDFGGLDDLMTEDPAVLKGMIAIYGGWIDRLHIDGYRIDTAKHVNAQFWQAFVPAILARARARGIPHFHIFGEVSSGDLDPALLAEHTRVDRLPAVLDFAFQNAVVAAVSGQRGTDVLAQVFAGDVLYQGGAASARSLPTFLGNHDGGRFGYLLRKAGLKAGDQELLARVALGHALLLTLRGVPTIYAGDEQGFVGIGWDQGAREDQFGSQVAAYNAETLLGTSATTATASFHTDHPLYRLIAELARIRQAEPALRRGAQAVRHAQRQPGLFALSRFEPGTGREVLLAYNTSTEPLRQQVLVNVASRHFRSLHGQCAADASAPGSVTVELPPLGFVVCKAAP
jgi:glycosidase